MLSGQKQFLQIFTSEQLVDSLNAERTDVEREQSSINQPSDIFATGKNKYMPGHGRLEGRDLQLDCSGKDY